MISYFRSEKHSGSIQGRHFREWTKAVPDGVGEPAEGARVSAGGHPGSQDEPQEESSLLLDIFPLPRDSILDVSVAGQ